MAPCIIWDTRPFDKLRVIVGKGTPYTVYTFLIDKFHGREESDLFACNHQLELASTNGKKIWIPTGSTETYSPYIAMIYVIVH